MILELFNVLVQVRLAKIKMDPDNITNFVSELPHKLPKYLRRRSRKFRKY